MINSKWMGIRVLASVACLISPVWAEAPRQPELKEAMAALVDSISRSETELRAMPFYESDQDQAAAYMHLVSMLIKSLEEEVIQDPDYPLFRVLDFRIREGGDNADQTYLLSRIRGSVEYRIWGRKGATDRLSVQLYEGEPWAGQGKVGRYLDHEDIKFGPDGSFEIFLSPTQRGENWIKNPEQSTSVIVRQIYANWTAKDPGEVHIDRVGYEGKRKPAIDTKALTSRLLAAARSMHTSSVVWPQFVQKNYVEKRSPNRLSDLQDTAIFGGLSGRWMANGMFALKADEALVIKTWPTQAKYQGIQLTDRWFSSLEYASAVSSLTTTQAVQAPDGAYYFVIAQNDPGYANWLDTQGFASGVILLRYDGVRGDIPQERWPAAQLVKVQELPSLIPGFGRVAQQAREQTLLERRRHVQVRFHR